MNRFSNVERKDDAYHIYERAKLNRKRKINQPDF